MQVDGFSCRLDQTQSPGAFDDPLRIGQEFDSPRWLEKPLLDRGFFVSDDMQIWAD